MTVRVFFDTNILVYAHDHVSSDKRATAQNLIFRCLRDNTGVISPQVLSEFFVTVTRKIKTPLSEERARNEVELLSVMSTVDLDATLVLNAIDNQRRWKLSYWDGLIIAAARRAQCGILYSEDLTDGQFFEGVTIRNPFLAANPGQPDALHDTRMPCGD